MTSYDRYLEYVRSPPFYHQHQHHHHQCLRLQHQLLDEPGGGAGWRTGGLRIEEPSAESGPSLLGPQQASTPTACVEGGYDSRRRPALPAFTIDAILSSAGTTTGSRMSESTSGSDWSRAQSQQGTAVGGCQLDTTTQLARGIESRNASYTWTTRIRRFEFYRRGDKE